MKSARGKLFRTFESSLPVWMLWVHLTLPGLCIPLPRGWSTLSPGGLLYATEMHDMGLPLADPETFLDQHRSKLGINARNIFHIAPQGFEEVDVASKGAWRKLHNGSSLWRLAIKSPGATSHVLIFSELALPWAGEFSIYSPSETANRTQCSSSCMIVPARAMPSQKLTTLAMQGEEVVLEYYYPAPAPPTSAFVVRIASIMQGLEGGQSLPKAAELRRRRRRQLLVKSQETKYTPGTGFDMSLLQRKNDSVSSCTSSVLCDSRWDLINDSILDIYAVNPQLHAMALCSGTLITAPFNRKFVLTADHCFVDKTEINSFEYWILIFNYEQPCGSTKQVAIKQVVQGLNLVFYDSKADVLLLEITATLPDSFTPYKLGFDASLNAVPRSAVGIHHPSGNFKHISYANASDNISTNFTAPKFPEGEVQPSDTTHFQVHWSEGATAGGSSGSPLIDVETGKVVGVLTGGFASCDDQSGPDYYGRLSAAWKNGLEHFLSSAPPDGILDEVAEILASSSEGGAIVVRTMNSSLSAKHGPGLGFFPDVLTFTPGEWTKSFTYFLTDPVPHPNETIIMNITVRGSIKGNLFDMSSYVVLSDSSDIFNPEDVFAYKRSIDITLFPGLNQSTYFVPGNLERFQLIFTLSSTVDPNYLHIHTLKGIAKASPGPWNQYKPTDLDCEGLPCYKPYPGRNASDLADRFAEYNLNATMDESLELAIFEFRPHVDVNVQMEICLESGVLIGATVSIYINKEFTWTLSNDPFGDPNCLHIASIPVNGGDNYTVVLSDEDNFDAVLPSRTVQYLYFADTDEDIVNSTIVLGPVAAGAEAPAAASKADRSVLPPDALLATAMPAGAPRSSAALHPAVESTGSASVRPLSASAAHKRARAPSQSQPLGRERAASGGSTNVIVPPVPAPLPGEALVREAPTATPSPSSAAAGSAAGAARPAATLPPAPSQAV